jgi:hypothetical protein
MLSFNKRIGDAPFPNGMSIWPLLAASSVWHWVDQVCINQKDKMEMSCQFHSSDAYARVDP